MGQILSNLLSIFHGRKKKKVETTAEENGKTRVPEKNEEAVVIVIDNAEVREDVEPFPPASGDRRSRVSEDERLAITVDSGVEVVEKIKPILHVSTSDKITVSTDDLGVPVKDEGAVVIVIDDAEIREDVEPFPDASGDLKTRVSEDERVAITVDIGVEVVEKIKPVLQVSTGDKITVLTDDLRAKALNRRVLQEEERRIKHYCSSQKMLLVGEGDFSFSACLAKVFGSADNMVVNSLNSEGFLKENYRNAMSNINDLKSRGCMVLHGVDATLMLGHEFLKGMRFDRIVFSFPYASFFQNESRNSIISQHQKLVTLFFKNATRMLSKEGEIHISHKSNAFHCEWNIASLASLSGLNFIKAEKFNLSDYPGYNTKYGFGGDGNFNCNPNQTYMFGL